MKKIKILLVCFLAAFLSCSKSEDATPITQDPNGNNPSVPDPYAGYDIYASGSQANYGVLWKNGKILYQDPVDYSIVRTGNFFISGSNIYECAEKKYRNLSGFENQDYNTGGCILKNGIILFGDTGPYTNTSEVVVSGNDVYYLTTGPVQRASSLAPTRPKLWKNGQILYDLYAIANNFGEGYKVFSLQIVNNDIYVGCLLNNDKRGCFKNGVLTLIDQASNYINASIYDGIVVTPNNDIYYKLNYITAVAGGGLGYDNNFKVYKNGIAIAGTQISLNKNYVTHMQAVGNDVYMLGKDNNKNTLWKNGVRNYLPDDNATNPVLTDEIFAFDIVDNKTFIAGKEVKSFPSGGLAIPYPQVWELKSTNTNTIISEAEVTSTIYSDDRYQIDKLIVIKK